MIFHNFLFILPAKLKCQTITESLSIFFLQFLSHQKIQKTNQIYIIRKKIFRNTFLLQGQHFPLFSPPNPQEVNFLLIKTGDDPAILLRSVQKLLSKIFVPAVRVNPSDLDTSASGVSARDHLLAGLRSFASCLHGKRGRGILFIGLGNIREVVFVRRF